MSLCHRDEEHAPLSIIQAPLRRPNSPHRPLAATATARPPLDENDSIFDKFECAVSGDGQSFLTGSYSNVFHIYNRDGAPGIATELTKAPGGAGSAAGSPVAASPTGCAAPAFGAAAAAWQHGGAPAPMDTHDAASASPLATSPPGSFAPAPPAPPYAAPPVSTVDFSRRVLHLAWHPHRDVVAVAGLDKLYLYSVADSAAGGGWGGLRSPRGGASSPLASPVSHPAPATVR